jgi:predicted Zn-ribbon and HTH transcriptional regulator
MHFDGLHFHSGWKASIIVRCLPEIEGDTLAALQSERVTRSSPLLPMIMIETVKRMLRQSDRELVVECRHCGSNVDPTADSCPVCDSTEIAQYEIPR